MTHNPKTNLIVTNVLGMRRLIEKTSLLKNHYIKNH